MRWLVSAWYGFLLRCFFKRVVLILNYKLLCVKKCNCPIVYSEIPLCRDSFSCGDRSAGKQCGLIAWFLYSARYSIEGFLKNLLESFINNLCVKICNSYNTLQFFHMPLNNVSEILWKILQFIFSIFLTLYLFTLWSCFQFVWQNSNQLSLNVISLLCFTQLLWICSS